MMGLRSITSLSSGKGGVGSVLTFSVSEGSVSKLTHPRPFPEKGGKQYALT